MRIPPGIPTRRLLQVLLVFALLCIILNPELRALIFFVDAIGFEIAFLLIALQMQVLGAMIAPAIRRLAVTSCKVVFRLGHLALAAYPARVNSGKLHRVLCPVLIGLSYGVRCHAVP